MDSRIDHQHGPFAEPRPPSCGLWQINASTVVSCATGFASASSLAYDKLGHSHQPNSSCKAGTVQQATRLHRKNAPRDFHASRPVAGICIGWSLALLLPVLSFGCGQSSSTGAIQPGAAPGKTSNSRSVLRHARYAQLVPIPESLRLRERLVGPSHDLGGTPQMDAVVWVFHHDQPQDELIAYYRKTLPRAEVTEINLQGPATELRVIPTGARPHEEVVVTIRAGEVQVRETIAPVPLAQLAEDAPTDSDTFRR
jgi:hypothetical protein